MRKNTIITGMTLFFTLMLFSLCLAEEQLSITTYYPSPYGSYNDLMVNRRLAIGGGKYDQLINTSLPGFTDGMYINDAAIFVPVNTGDTYSDLRLYIEDNADDRFSIWGNSCGGGGCGDLNSSSNIATFRADGNVGIGTTDPKGRLEIDGDPPADANAAQLVIRENTTDNTFLIGRTQAYSFVQSHNTEPLALNPLGNNVGIGTTDPKGRLEIDGDPPADANAAQLVIRENTTDNTFLIGRTQAYSFVQSHNTEPLALNPLGNNVGIGTDSPDYTLDVNGKLRAGTDSVISNLTFANFTAAHGNDSERISSGHNIIINSTTGQVALTTDPQGDYAVSKKVTGSSIWLCSSQVNNNSIEMDGSDLKFQGTSMNVPDIAESIYAPTAEAGDVVIADPKNNVTAIKSNKAYDATALGIISTAPTLYLNGKDSYLPRKGNSPPTKNKEGYLPLSLAGRVFCKVTAENGPIKRGDALVSSSKPGYAMRADLSTPEAKLKALGAIIGKALEPLEKDEGKIIVLVNLN